MLARLSAGCPDFEYTAGLAARMGHDVLVRIADHSTATWLQGYRSWMFLIRHALPGDAAALSQLAERTFRDAFTAQNRQSDIDTHCARAFAPEIQARELATPTTATLVIEQEGRLVAYAQIQYGPQEGAKGEAEIRRFYVARPFQGTGLAQQLMQRVVDDVVSREAKTIWLGVWDENPRAIRFYGKCGFEETGEREFLLGASQQRDLVMSRPTRPD